MPHGEDRARLTVFLTLFRYFSFVPKLGSMSLLQETGELPKVHKPSTANGTKRRERTCIGEAGSGNKLHEFRVGLERKKTVSPQRTSTRTKIGIYIRS